MVISIKKKDALKETLKFVGRMLILGLPFLATYLANNGYTELGGLASALLIVLDKYIHESPTDRTGIVNF